MKLFFSLPIIWLLWLFHVSADEGTTSTVLQQQEHPATENHHLAADNGDTVAGVAADTAPPGEEPEPAQQETEDGFEETAADGSNLSDTQHLPDERQQIVNEEAEPTTTSTNVTSEEEPASKDESTSSASSTNTESPQLGGTGNKQRLWGSPTPIKEDGLYHAAPPTTKESVVTTADKEDNEPATSSSTTTTSHHGNLHIPFVPPKHPPPHGFTIAARVYIDPNDKLGHIDEAPLTLPYWDCGTVGSTTLPLPVKEATFRHSLTPSQGWSGTDGKHPILAIALSEFRLETSGGDSKTIQPGQAILLEDVLVKGHKIRPINHHDVRVLFLTLPNTHYRTGKDHISIPTTIIKPTSSDPCPLPDQMQELSTMVVQRDTQIRRVFFGLVGLSLSTILADFLGKTAPLWLAVGVGGTFFVVGGTIGTIALGEAAVSNFQAWMLSRRLSVSKDDTPSL